MSRAVIIDLRTESGRGAPRCTIVLQHGDRTVEGTAEGELSPRLAGEATLRAVEALVEDTPFELLAVATTDLGAARIALAQVKDGDRVLVGNALLGENDPDLAAVKAVMDAINRRLDRVLA